MKPKSLSNEFVDKLGFGCGRIVGGASLNKSTELIESALQIGITHFDVAPSYGLGTAENALGEILKGDTSIQIATKVGIARPSGGNQLSFLRKYLGPIVKNSKTLTNLTLKFIAQKSERGLFSVELVEKSFEESLKRLGRDYVDYLLLHEPTDENINPELEIYCESLLKANKTRNLGIGTNEEVYSGFHDFGNVLQYRVSANSQIIMPSKQHIIHGALRNSLNEFPLLSANNEKAIHPIFAELGWDINDNTYWAPTLLALKMLKQSNYKVLVSFSTIKKMHETLSLSNSFYLEYKNFYSKKDN